MRNDDPVTPEEVRRFEGLALDLGVLGCSSRGGHFGPSTYHEMNRGQMEVGYACLNVIADRDQAATYECEHPSPPMLPLSGL